MEAELSRKESSVRRVREVVPAGHLKTSRMSGKAASVALPTDPLIRRDQTCLPGLVGIDHDLGGPVVAPRTVTGLALNAGQSLRPRRVASRAARPLKGGRGGRPGRLQAIGGAAMSGRSPALVDGPVTELAPLGPNVTSVVAAQTTQTKHGDEPAKAATIRRHPFIFHRLARAHPERQGAGHPNRTRGM
jgi:hypothetical protein